MVNKISQVSCHTNQDGPDHYLHQAIREIAGVFIGFFFYFEYGFGDLLVGVKETIDFLRSLAVFNNHDCLQAHQEVGVL